MLCAGFIIASTKRHKHALKAYICQLDDHDLLDETSPDEEVMPGNNSGISEDERIYGAIVRWPLGGKGDVESSRQQRMPPAMEVSVTEAEVRKRLSARHKDNDSECEVMGESDGNLTEASLPDYLSQMGCTDKILHSPPPRFTIYIGMEPQIFCSQRSLILSYPDYKHSPTPVFLTA